MRVAFNSTVYDAVVFVSANMISYNWDNRRVQIHTEAGLYVSCAMISYDEYREMTEDLLKNGYLNLSGNAFDLINNDNFTS